MKLYDHHKIDVLDYRFILSDVYGKGFLFRFNGKIEFSTCWNMIQTKYISEKEFVIDEYSRYHQHIFLSPSNEIYLKCGLSPYIHAKDIYVNIKTFEEYEGDIADLKPFNKKLTLKNK